MTASEDLKVIRLTEADAERLATHHAAAFPPGQAWQSEAFRELLAQDTVCAHGVMSGATLIAFGLAQIAVDQAEILTLACHPDHRRSGVARELLTHLEHILSAQGVEKWILDVAEDNPVAIAFYTALGFQTDGRRPNYYKRLEGGRVDAILMSKPMARQITT